MSKMKLILSAKSDMGRQRTNNEDAFVVEKLDDSTVLAVAIDGVGGYEGGEVAADIARREIPAYLKQFNRGERLELLKQAVVAANNSIFEQRQVDEKRPNMSCVLTAALIDAGRGVVDMVHVGDTRLYQFHHGVLRKLSHDHSLVGYREEIGDLTEEEAMNHPQRNVINRDVGSARHEISDDDFLEAAEFPLLPNSIFLLCSDGLTDLITSQQITEVLEQNLSLEQKTQELVDAANIAGGKDNITVVLVDYQADMADEVRRTSVKHDPNMEEPALNNQTEVSVAKPTAKKKSKRSLKIVIAILLIVAVVAGVCSILLPRLKKDSQIKPTLDDTSLRDSQNVVSENDFEFMYGNESENPWSCYINEDSTCVLRLEKLYGDSLGNAYRVLLFAKEYWRNGGLIYPRLGDEPVYVGYGTDYYPSPNILAVTTISGFVDSDDEPLIIYASRGQWDSLVTVLCDPCLDLYDSVNVFKKQSWDELLKWWNVGEDKH